jgi:hypothetical protein
MFIILSLGTVLMAVMTAKSSIREEEAHPKEAPLKEIRGVSFLIKIQLKPCYICDEDCELRLLIKVLDKDPSV